jgi:hypothetical protein
MPQVPVGVISLSQENQQPRITARPSTVEDQPWLCDLASESQALADANLGSFLHRGGAGQRSGNPRKMGRYMEVRPGFFFWYWA